MDINLKCVRRASAAINGEQQRGHNKHPRIATWLVVALLIPSVAQAYIDPNTGSTILFRFLFPMFVAIGAGWVFLKNKISVLIARIRGKSKAKTE
jgi:hypothetical protein